ncbi:MAG: hypothetical protein H6Q69_1454 [Firmicutes bacterium]|nr:hypothetical protein [Bacillota bacterium]
MIFAEKLMQKFQGLPDYKQQKGLESLIAKSKDVLERWLNDLLIIQDKGLVIFTLAYKSILQEIQIPSKILDGILLGICISR